MSDAWDRQRVAEAEAKRCDAEAAKAEAEANLATVKREDLIKAKVRQMDAESKANVYRANWHGVEAVSGRALGVHVAWACATVAVSYILGVLMVEILYR